MSSLSKCIGGKQWDLWAEGWPPGSALFMQGTTHILLVEDEDLNLNCQTREVYCGDRMIELTAKEFDLLEYLLTDSRQVITRDQILERAWGYDFVGDSNIVEVYIRYLRLKLEANQEKRLLQIVRGTGFVLRD